MFDFFGSQFSKLKTGLTKTRNNLSKKIQDLIRFNKELNSEFYEELEEILILSDVGVDTTQKIIEQLKKDIRLRGIKTSDECKQLLKEILIQFLIENQDEFVITSPTVITVVGVNGVGKTTTIAKLASKYKAAGKKIILAAGDTFRAAATEQLEIWGQRLNVDVIKHKEGSDPSAVIFDAINASKARGADILICDTAGRLHTKTNLMNELSKIKKVIDREYVDAQKEVFLVLDATTGQNALQQVKIFREATDITGIVLTKLDGTAKGGIVVAIKSEFKFPIRYIGIGEQADDLQEFNAQDFVNALLDF
ncbi:signal recognition particle-docking protein FtsY [Calorimonas adulescens]|uniref:Signal recognition particle receptor FtsY n=1 Tax=Calorimonas adulescens TaxID=2606906 RepID=A0A5D8QGN0_9THEO|nr:signal recognition particle-docking protein FtsY [Calorimonas adulescens]TZE83379.1 signal recognition particle-docking protein FtsY [Calorimonas adulescens]